MSFQPEERGPPALTGGFLESETELRELSAKLVLAVLLPSTLGFLSLPLHWIFFEFSFHHGWALSPSWASAVLGLCLAGAEPRLFQPG